MTTFIVGNQNQTQSPNQVDFTLKDIIKSLPKECFEKNPRKAWTGLIISVLMVIFGYASITFAPWFLLPVAWVFTGTALTGFFVIGHDCGHRSFSNRRWVNDLVGHLAFLPLIYPFHSWRIGHNYHHKHTNKLDYDNAWHPIRPDVYESWHPVYRIGYRLLLTKKLWWLGSIGHWLVIHFDWRNFDRKDRGNVKLSVFVVLIGAAIAFPALFLTTGIWGFVKFWFIPWLVYHFWMSTFTYVHHTTPSVPFKSETDWNEALAQLSGTVHCDYPRWVEFLCHDINVHVPHHISTGIPSYNLRKAYQSIKENWGEYLHDEYKFSWSLMKDLTDKCQLYREGEGYLSFQEYRNQSVNSTY